MDLHHNMLRTVCCTLSCYVFSYSSFLILPTLGPALSSFSPIAYTWLLRGSHAGQTTSVSSVLCIIYSGGNIAHPQVKLNLLLLHRCTNYVCYGLLLRVRSFQTADQHSIWLLFNSSTKNICLDTICIQVTLKNYFMLYLSFLTLQICFTLQSKSLTLAKTSCIV